MTLKTLKTKETVKTGPHVLRLRGLQTVVSVGAEDPNEPIRDLDPALSGRSVGLSDPSPASDAPSGSDGDAGRDSSSGPTQTRQPFRWPRWPQGSVRGLAYPTPGGLASEGLGFSRGPPSWVRTIFQAGTPNNCVAVSWRSTEPSCA